MAVVFFKRGNCIVCNYICLCIKFYHEQTKGGHSQAQGEEKYLSPVDVKEFRTDILEAGTWLASMLTVEYPDADLVSAALYNVSEVVEDFSIKGKWVTSRNSSAKNNFLVTRGIREVSSITSVI